jgi:hypothetical protein
MGAFMHSDTPRFWHHEMTVTHTLDPIVDPERLFEGFENRMPFRVRKPLLLERKLCSVILSAAAASQSEADAESKDPLSARDKTNAAMRSHETAR